MPVVRDLIRNVLVLCLFLGAVGFVLTEMLLTWALPLLPSVRALVFPLVVLICWLLLDAVTLAYDLARAEGNPSTEGERRVLRSLSYANRRRALVDAWLEGETKRGRRHMARSVSHSGVWY